MSESWDETYDVVVVGSGAAGFTAAVVAASEGASVLILENAPGPVCVIDLAPPR